MDGGAWWAAVHGVSKSRTRLSDFTFTFHFHVSEKEMATHSSVLAWRIPGTGEPGGLPSMGSHRVGHDWSDLAAAVGTIVGQLEEFKKYQECIFKKMWYISTEEYYSAIKKNEIMSFAATGMDLEIIILSEVSQRKKNIIWYHLNVESKKMIQMNLFTKQKQTYFT